MVNKSIETNAFHVVVVGVLYNFQEYKGSFKTQKYESCCSLPILLCINSDMLIILVTFTPPLNILLKGCC